MSPSLHLLVMLMQAATANCPTDAVRPMFECEAVLEFELELPVKTLKRHAEDRPVVDAVLRYEGSNGETVVLDAQVTTRGHSRLETCTYPPLSLLLDEKDVKGTVFAGQKKLKVVLQCRKGSRYLDYLRQEYGVYKAYEVVADPAFRVRLLSINFRDAENTKREEQHVAFFIESIREVAKRRELERVRLNRIPPQHLDARNSSIYELFQFLIANTDWSKTKGPGDEDCCHNGKVLAPPGTDTGWFVLPYDFDQSGLINAPYALPHERLPIRSVTQRLFRGRCEFLHHMDDTIAIFNERRDEIESALASGGVTEKTDRSQRNYVARFYDIVNDPEKRKRYVDDKCRGPR